MSYTVKQLAKLAGVSARTLRYYDHVGLLKPARVADNGYRVYGESELLRLQQILLYKELDLSLEDIGRILDQEGSNTAQALRRQRARLVLRKERLTRILQTIDQTIDRLTIHTPMSDKDLYGGLSEEEYMQYRGEAAERWGEDRVAESERRIEQLSKGEREAVRRSEQEIYAALASLMDQDPSAQEVQDLIERHYQSLHTYYEPNRELYRGLADIYTADARFEAFFEKIAPGLAAFMSRAMHVYCDTVEVK